MQLVVEWSLKRKLWIVPAMTKVETIIPIHRRIVSILRGPQPRTQITLALLDPIEMEPILEVIIMSLKIVDRERTGTKFQHQKILRFPVTTPNSIARAETQKGTSNFKLRRTLETMAWTKEHRIRAAINKFQATMVPFQSMPTSILTEKFWARYGRHKCSNWMESYAFQILVFSRNR